MRGTLKFSGEEVKKKVKEKKKKEVRKKGSTARGYVYITPGLSHLPPPRLERIRATPAPCPMRELTKVDLVISPLRVLEINGKSFFFRNRESTTS